MIVNIAMRILLPTTLTILISTVMAIVQICVISALLDGGLMANVVSVESHFIVNVSFVTVSYL